MTLCLPTQGNNSAFVRVGNIGRHQCTPIFQVRCTHLKATKFLHKLIHCDIPI